MKIKDVIYYSHMHTNTYTKSLFKNVYLFPDVPIEKRTIPSQVFGSLKTVEDEDD